MSSLSAAGVTRGPGWLGPVFFGSGCSALLYQVVWQRSLMTLYGSNSESVALIVSCFMLGLGLGSLAGGLVSARPRCPHLLLFAAAELAIGLFGASSQTLFGAVGHATLSLAPAATAVTVFLLVVVPTLLMGGTLPLLVAYSVARTRNVGDSVGALYFMNTAGSAAGAWLAGGLILQALGVSRTTLVAAGLNVLVALVALHFWRREQAA
jgi:predicted membrane-bound spermidine synthase